MVESKRHARNGSCEGVLALVWRNEIAVEIVHRKGNRSMGGEQFITFDFCIVVDNKAPKLLMGGVREFGYLRVQNRQISVHKFGYLRLVSVSLCPKIWLFEGRCC